MSRRRRTVRAMIELAESRVEHAALARLETFGYKVEHGSNIGMGELVRSHCIEAVL
jgi:hypothetical protein